MAPTITTEFNGMTIYTGEYALILRFRKRQYPRREPGERGPVQDNDSPYGRGRMYFDLAENADQNVLDSIMARGTEPSSFYKKLAPIVYKELIGHSIDKFSWSRKAGCTMCPCSPGIIVEGQLMQGIDVWVTVVKGGEREVVAYQEAQKAKRRDYAIKSADYERAKFQKRVDEAEEALRAAKVALDKFNNRIAHMIEARDQEVNGLVAQGVS